jgi:hypothetical protein
MNLYKDYIDIYIYKYRDYIYIHTEIAYPGTFPLSGSSMSLVASRRKLKGQRPTGSRGLGLGPNDAMTR